MLCVGMDEKLSCVLIVQLYIINSGRERLKCPKFTLDLLLLMCAIPGHVAVFLLTRCAGETAVSYPQYLWLFLAHALMNC